MKKRTEKKMTKKIKKVRKGNCQKITRKRIKKFIY